MDGDNFRILAQKAGFELNEEEVRAMEEWYVSFSEQLALLDRIDTEDAEEMILPETGSFHDTKTTVHDPSLISTQTAAEALDRAYRAQEELGAVITFIPGTEGMPAAVKDNFDTAGIRTTGGSRILAENIPEEDAEAVRRLKKAGIAIIAKTAMDELSMGAYGTTCFTGPVHNPWDRERTAGGSSAGSAVLTAAGIVPLALGTDTGDSIRRPASYCGIVGVKPSYGRISRRGVIPYAASLDHVGYFTRNIQDARTALQILAGKDEGDPTSSACPVPDYLIKNLSLKGKRIAVFDNAYAAERTPAIREAFSQILRFLWKQGAEVFMFTLEDELMEAIRPVYSLIANSEGVQAHLRLGKGDLHTRTEGFGTAAKQRFTAGMWALEHDSYIHKARKVRRLISEHMYACLDTYDALIAPTCSTIAPKLSEAGVHADSKADPAEDHLILTNFSGQPSMSIPLGFSEGCPFGLCITCGMFREKEMFDIAEALEMYTGLKDLSVNREN